MAADRLGGGAAVATPMAPAPAFANRGGNHGKAVKIAAALSGGGSKGAFQVGVLQGLADLGVEIDAFAGVSTGAIQALAGAVGDFKALEVEWRSITSNRDIYRLRLPPIRSKYDATPLRQRLERFAGNRLIKKPVRIGVVSLQSGAFRLAEGEKDQPAAELVPWVYASCMIPVEYEPVRVGRLVRDATQWIDGGARTVTPLKVAAEFHPCGIFMIRAHPKPTVPYDGRDFWNLIDIGKRAVDVLQSEVSLDDIAGAELSNRYVQIRSNVAGVLARNKVPDRVCDAVLGELDAFAREHGLVRVCAIGPAYEYSMTNNYHPHDIAYAIDSGRAAVAERQAEIEAFVRLCRQEQHA